MKIWNMLLIITTFVLTTLGTFITRSGVLNSVHAFGKTNIGPAFLAFIAITVIFAYFILSKRIELLSSKSEKSGWVSKENIFLLNNIIFTGMAFTVLYGTVFPLLSEGLANKKISIQAPFFNTIMLPMGVIVVFLMGLSHVLGWKNTGNSQLIKNNILPGVVSIAVSLGLLVLTSVDWELILLSWVVAYAGVHVLVELMRRKKNRKPRGMLGFFSKDRRRKGGLIVHLGIVILGIGLCGNFFSHETTFSIYPGETHEFGGYTLHFDKIIETTKDNTERVGARINVSEDGKPIGTLTPVKAHYPTSSQSMSEVAIRRTVLEDLYLNLANINEDGSVTLTAYVNPLVNFVWASMVFFTIGLAYSFSYKPVQLRKKKSN